MNEKPKKRERLRHSLERLLEIKKSDLREKSVKLNRLKIEENRMVITPFATKMKINELRREIDILEDEIEIFRALIKAKYMAKPDAFISTMPWMQNNKPTTNEVKQDEKQ